MPLWPWVNIDIWSCSGLDSDHVTEFWCWLDNSQWSYDIFVSFGKESTFASPQCLHGLRKSQNAEHCPMTCLSSFELYIVNQPGAVHQSTKHVTSCRQQVALWQWVNIDIWIWSGRDCGRVKEVWGWLDNAQRSSHFFVKMAKMATESKMGRGTVGARALNIAIYRLLITGEKPARWGHLALWRTVGLLMLRKWGGARSTQLDTMLPGRYTLNFPSSHRRCLLSISPVSQSQDCSPVSQSQDFGHPPHLLLKRKSWENLSTDTGIYIFM